VLYTSGSDELTLSTATDGTVTINLGYSAERTDLMPS